MIHTTRPGLILGFHGCNARVRDLLITEEVLMNPSTEPYDWLGSGCYFRENSYGRAYDFACHPPGDKIICSPAVIGAVIDLQFCLDLLDRSCLELLHDSFKELDNAVKEAGGNLPESKNVNGSRDLILRHLDCAVIENLHKKRKIENKRPYDSVRSVFVEGEALYPGAGINDKNHIQICIRNPNCIKGYFNPVKEKDWPAGFEHVKVPGIGLPGTDLMHQL
jgi:hypothetical protein